MTPQGFLATHPMFQAVNADVQILQVHIFQGEQRGFLDAQAVVVNQGKERSVSG